jgi:hypothetical protein
LSDALSLDAWHDPFCVDGTTSAVYVELSFKEGRLGGDDSEFPFTFKLGLRKALLTVELESPLEIDRRSIARSVPEAAVELSRILSAKEIAERQIAGRAALSPAALHLAISGEAKKLSQVSRDDQMRIVQTVPEILVQPRPEDSRSYSWALEPSFSPTLKGQPWHPVDAPRIRMKSPALLAKIMPSVKVNVTCALEDVLISDILPKEDTLNGKIREIVYKDINVAAAVQHLKLVLRDADLEPGMFDNRFSNLIIASILAAPE